MHNGKGKGEGNKEEEGQEKIERQMARRINDNYNIE